MSDLLNLLKTNPKKVWHIIGLKRERTFPKIYNDHGGTGALPPRITDPL